MSLLMPRSVGELQLYRILQRANLLCYYAAFVQQGGDDVQQLCEAGEEEFLEIMALVGMATKPLHVRRLQKALRDWVTNPALFDQPLTSLPACSIPVYKLREDSPTIYSTKQKTQPTEPRAWSMSPSGAVGGAGTPGSESPSPSSACSPCWTGEPSEVLEPAVLHCVSECVRRLAPTLSRSDPAEVKGRLRGNKKLSQTITRLCELSEDDPQREEEIRKYSAIYGRFDSKRRDGRPLTTHELVVNEAAAQLCLLDGGLLTHRDQLFSLARHISREVTYRHAFRNRPSADDEEELLSRKRIKIEQEGVYSLQDSLYLLHMQQEALRERLACATAKGQEGITQALQVQLDTVFCRQVELLQDAAVQEQSVCPVALRYTSDPGDPNTDHTTRPPEERPESLYMIGRISSNGEIPLGRQLANELKQHNKHRRISEEPHHQTKNGTSQRELYPLDYRKIKPEPEDSR
ncbi:NGFI-A-binding protein 1a isoform X1 [Astyanax mexicanus]|uniref:NGFI-A-binding protein 1a isoform X1 n=1 Tax=Astyanax mexicanus TaxID=7994 RepID=UPI0020CABD10|nr:NGFI-A-binding protein 1a isoform X1 [Astyanax mexicanus]XP_022521144.2 NGFI-A-binding protein 1a isoform X1 [Astyanax mexicanus]